MTWLQILRHPSTHLRDVWRQTVLGTAQSPFHPHQWIDLDSIQFNSIEDYFKEVRRWKFETTQPHNPLSVVIVLTSPTQIPDHTHPYDPTHSVAHLLVRKTLTTGLCYLILSQYFCYFLPRNWAHFSEISKNRTLERLSHKVRYHLFGPTPFHLNFSFCNSICDKSI